MSLRVPAVPLSSTSSLPSLHHWASSFLWHSLGCLFHMHTSMLLTTEYLIFAERKPSKYNFPSSESHHYMYLPPSKVTSMTVRQKTHPEFRTWKTTWENRKCLHISSLLEEAVRTHLYMQKGRMTKYVMALSPFQISYLKYTFILSFKVTV